jgi:Sodium:sulfate symporter transmembrane region
MLACRENGRIASRLVGWRDGTRGRCLRITWKTIAPPGVWLALYLNPVPAGLNANQWHYFAIFAAVITGLILESMPVGRGRPDRAHGRRYFGLCRA